jgi:hypothetical protein
VSLGFFVFFSAFLRGPLRLCGEAVPSSRVVEQEGGKINSSPQRRGGTQRDAEKPTDIAHASLVGLGFFVFFSALLRGPLRFCGEAVPSSRAVDH